MSLVTGPRITGVMAGATLGAPYLTDGNRFLRMMQTLIQPNVINQTTTTPPATPNSGDTYIVGTGATGAWSGKDTQIAYWAAASQSFTTAAWDFYVPVEGWSVYDQSTNSFYLFDGAAWVPYAFGAGAAYDIICYAPGTYTNSQVILSYNVIHSLTLAAGLSGAIAKAQVASTGSVDVTIKKNGSSIGTITFAASATGSFTFSSTVTVVAGDVISFTAPASADGTLAGVAFTIPTTRTA